MSINKLLEQLEEALGEYPFSIITTILFSAIFSVLIFWVCFNIGEKASDHVFNIFVVLLGALLGWALGIFFAPYDENEAVKFSSIGQTVSVFVSGYVISKLDRFLEATMFVPNADSEVIMITWVRIGLLFSAFLVTMLTVFVNRSYFRQNAQQKTEQEKNMINGSKKQSLNTAQIMKIDNEPIDKIVKYTQLSIEEIEGIKE